jgi:hypothetical protein
VSRGTRPRGRAIAIHAAAFVAMLGGGVALVMASLGSLQSTRVLWVSAMLSYAAIVLAVMSLLVSPAQER